MDNSFLKAGLPLFERTEKPDGMVVIDPTSGKVTLTKELDREDPAFDEGGFINIVIQAKEDPKGENWKGLKKIVNLQ